MTETPSAGGPTVGRKVVGGRLRRLRTDKGISREQAGERIRASPWKIHRLENGQVGFKERDLVDLLGLYGVTDAAAVSALVEAAREASAPSWASDYADVIPAWFRGYVDMESAATVIRAYEGQYVPGLLQTEDYMRAVIRGAHLGDTAEGTERRIRFRLARHELLTRSSPRPPRLWAVVDEAALRRPVGGSEVMRAQVVHLAGVAKLPNVTIQILPLDTGAHPAMVSAFSILRFDGVELPDVVYVEHLTSAQYLDKPDDVDRYLHVMETICVRAAPPDQTGERLDDLLRSVYP